MGSITPGFAADFVILSTDVTADRSGAKLLEACVDETWVAGVRRYSRAPAAAANTVDGVSTGASVESSAAAGMGVASRPEGGGGVTDPYSAGRHGPTRAPLAIGAMGCPCCSAPTDFGRMFKARGGRGRPGE